MSKLTGDITLSAVKRTDTGKGASRRLRRLNDMVPAIIYGGDSEPEMLSIPHKDLLHELDNESFFSSIINLEIDGTAQDAILKDLQRHPAKPRVLHADFVRVVAGVELTIRVPLHFINAESAAGVVKDGGILSTSLTELQISCLPRNIPESIDVDVAALEVGDSLNISDLTMPEGVTPTDLMGEVNDMLVVSVQPPQAEIVDEDIDEEPTTEVIGDDEGDGAESDAPAAESDSSDEEPKED